MDSPVPPLSQLYTYLTSDCNCACKHCWISPTFSRKAFSERFLAPGLFRRAVEQAIPLGLTSVKLTGGEPTFHPHLDQLLQVCAEHKITTHMETNGLKMSKTMAGIIADAGCKHVSVSLDGATASTHDTIRGVKGAFEAAKAGARNLLEAGVSTQLITTLTGPSFDERYEVIKLAEKLGVGSLKFNLVQPVERGKVLQEAKGAPSVQDILHFKSEIDETLQAQSPAHIILDVPMAFRSLTEYLEHGFPRCNVFSIIGVLADGSYALCGIGQNLPDMVFGNIEEDDLKVVWETHPVLKTLRQRVPMDLGGICGECLMKDQCLGSCIADNYYQSGTLVGDFWFCREADQAGLFPETRRKPLA